MEISSKVDPPPGLTVLDRAWVPKGHLFFFNLHIDNGDPTTIEPKKRVSPQWMDSIGWSENRRNVLMTNDIISARIFSLERSEHHWKATDLCIGALSVKP